MENSTKNKYMSLRIGLKLIRLQFTGLVSPDVEIQRLVMSFNTRVIKGVDHLKKHGAVHLS